MKPKSKPSQIFLLFFLVFSGCMNTIETTNTKIHVELTDDVTPLRGLFSIDEKVSDTEWQINDSLVNGADGWPEGEYVLDYIFEKEGHYDITLNADTYDYYHKIFGTTELNIPGHANKLKIYGIDFRNKIISTADINLKIKFRYTYNSTIQLESERIVQYSPNIDSIDFIEPLIIDLPNLRLHKPKIDVDLLNSSTSENYFKGDFWLNHSYFAERLFSNPRKGEFFEEGTGKSMYLNLDWYIE